MRQLRYIGMMLTALVWASCSNEEFLVDEVAEQKVVVTEGEFTNFSNTWDPSTRTLLDKDAADGIYKFYWTYGDAIWLKKRDGTYVQSKRSNIMDVQRQADFFFVGHYHDDSYPIYYTGRELKNVESGSHLTRRGILPNENGTTATQVTITPVQVQFLPNQAAHIAYSGDCGTATATRVTDPTAGYDYNFGELTHRASYLIFKPYTKNEPETNDCYLLKVKIEEIGGNGEIAGTYKFSDTGLGALIPDYNQRNSIELYCTTHLSKPVKQVSGEYVYDFDAADVLDNGIQPRFGLREVASTANAANMVIKPGTFKLKVTYSIEYNKVQENYWENDQMKFRVVPIITTRSFEIDTRQYKENYYYTIQHKLDLTAAEAANSLVFNQNTYYMWDAKSPYVSALPQPLRQNNAQHRNVEFSDSTFYRSPVSVAEIASSTDKDYSKRDAVNASFSTIPNANEMSYYVMYGEAYLDNETLWWLDDSNGNNGIYVGGRGPYLCRGGIWLKKKAAIMRDVSGVDNLFSKELSAPNKVGDRYDLRKETYSPTDNKNWQADYYGEGIPPADKINDYFFLPFLGYYQYNGSGTGLSGQRTLKMVGAECNYWSSTAFPYDNIADGGGAYMFSGLNRTSSAGKYIALKWREGNQKTYNFRAYGQVAGTRPDGTPWFQ